MKDTTRCGRTGRTRNASAHRYDGGRLPRACVPCHMTACSINELSESHVASRGVRRGIRRGARAVAAENGVASVTLTAIADRVGVYHSRRDAISARTSSCCCASPRTAAALVASVQVALAAPAPASPAPVADIVAGTLDADPLSKRQRGGGEAGPATAYHDGPCLAPSVHSPLRRSLLVSQLMIDQ